MKTFTLRSHFLIPTTPKSHLKPHPKKFLHHATNTLNHPKKSKPIILNPELLTKNIQNKHFPQLKPKGYSKYVILGTVSIGLVLFLMGVDDQKALALGPEGPLMEEFWDNMRRYGLYALTVSSGVLYAVFQPLAELLKNPISAILVLTIFGGGFYIVSQVVSAMVGVSDFNYQYDY